MLNVKQESCEYQSEIDARCTDYEADAITTGPRAGWATALILAIRNPDNLFTQTVMTDDRVERIVVKIRAVERNSGPGDKNAYGPLKFFSSVYCTITISTQCSQTCLKMIVYFRDQDISLSRISYILWLCNFFIHYFFISNSTGPLDYLGPGENCLPCPSLSLRLVKMWTHKLSRKSK